MAKAHPRIKRSNKDGIELSEGHLRFIKQFGATSAEVVASRLQAVGKRDSVPPEITADAVKYASQIAHVLNEQTKYVLNGAVDGEFHPPKTFGELRARFANGFESIPEALTQAVPELDARAHPSAQQVYQRMIDLLVEQVGKQLPSKAKGA